MKDLVQMIKNGTLDIAFIENDINEFDIAKEFLKQDELVIVSSDKKLLGNEYYIDELFFKDWILRESASGVVETFYDFLEGQKKYLNVTLQLQHTLSIKHILQKYPETISCLPLKSVEQNLANKDIFRVNIKNFNINRSYYLIYHVNKFQNVAFRFFKDYMKNNFPAL